LILGLAKSVVKLNSSKGVRGVNYSGRRKGRAKAARGEFSRAGGRIPLLKPWLVKPEALVGDLRKVWASGRLSLGEYTGKLEDRARELFGVKEVVAIQSCTSGLILTMKALGIGKKVVVPDYTFPATSHAAIWLGAEVVFCDVDLSDYTISPEALAGINDPEVEAVLAVNIFGLPPKVDEIAGICAEKGWKLIFDSAQGIGGEYRGRSIGGNGAAEVFSMSPSKLVTSAEGGMVTTNDTALASELRELRNYGKGRGEAMEGVGLSARLSELCAVLAWRNLGHLKELLAKRERLEKKYRKALAGIKGVAFQEWGPERKSGRNYFVVRITEEAGKSRDQAVSELWEQGIECRRYFYPAVHEIPAYRGKYAADCPNAVVLSSQAMALPFYSTMTAKEQDLVIERFEGVMTGR